MIQWATLDNHASDIRSSPNFQKWRALVADCLDGAPQAEHVTQIFKGF